METVEGVTRMRLVGGNLALDFINTRSGPPVGLPDDDVLTGYSELVAWGVYAGALTEAEATALRRLSRDDPDGASAAFARSLHTRDYLDEVFRALAVGEARTRPHWPGCETTKRMRSATHNSIRKHVRVDLARRPHARPTSTAGGARSGPAAHHRRAGPDQGMRRLPLHLQRREQEPQSPLVQHGRLRNCREDPPLRRRPRTRATQ